MCVELVEEVHEQVNLQAADAKNHVLLCLCPVPAVVTARLLPLHPEESQLLELGGQRDSGGVATWGATISESGGRSSDLACEHSTSLYHCVV